MTSTTPGPRRALSPAVYWRRRLFVGGVLLALVLIVVNVVRGGPDPGPGVRATTAGAEQTTAAESTGAPDAPVAGIEATKNGGRKAGRRGKGRTADAAPAPGLALPTAAVLAEPDGVCADDDIAVTPTVRDAVAGVSATVVLALRTLSAEACTWEISSQSLAVRVSVGDDLVWASWECPGQVPERSVVVRRAVATTYELTWNTRRSDTDCPDFTEYAQPGDYRVTAAAYGGEPDFVVFDLAAPQAPAPDPSPTSKKSSSRGSKG